MLDISVHEKELAIPRLSSRHDGLRIAHLSDLHMSGRITQRILRARRRAREPTVSRTSWRSPATWSSATNACAWIPDTLGRLRAPAGVYYVLGNHDRHVDAVRLHAALADAGLIHLGGTWRQDRRSRRAVDPGRQRAAVVRSGRRFERLPAARLERPAATHSALPFARSIRLGPIDTIST